MSIDSKRGSSIRRGSAIIAAIAGALSIAATAAYAGDCPADKRVVDGMGQKPSAAAARNVTDMVVVSTDLSKERVALKDHLFRARRLVIKPDGIVPWHSHDERPAMIYVVKGEIIEYASNCTVPIVHRAGEVSTETHATSHWWKNLSRRPVVLISADILHDRPGMM